MNTWRQIRIHADPDPPTCPLVLKVKSDGSRLHFIKIAF
jgi:hypothetical protein